MWECWVILIEIWASASYVSLKYMKAGRVGWLVDGFP